jgi:hypothetical protein
MKTPPILAPRKMINVKEAVSSATKALQDLFPGEKFAGLELEEVELTEDGKSWLITLGFDVPRKGVLSLPPAMMGYERKYKIFKVDGRTGNVTAMKIRKP